MGRFLIMINLFKKKNKPEDDYIIDSDFDPQSRLEKYKTLEKEYWKTKKLDEMNEDEWELLCDGCGKCCLAKMDDFKNKNKIVFTNVACRLLDHKTCLCKLYEHRFKIVNDCRQITIDAIREKPRWVPKTCAYWLLDNNKDLPVWHPLITGDVNTVHEAGKSVRERVISETEVINYNKHIVDWDDV